MEHLFSLLLWVFSLAGYETPRPNAGSAAPRITFRYAPYVDNLLCPLSRVVRPPVSVPDVAVDFDRLAADLSRELPRLQKVWDERGPELLKAASELLGSKFAYDQDEMGLFFCPRLPSWAKPRLISVWQYMPSVPASARWSDEEFVDVVFHEQLHMLVNRLLGWKLDSPTLERYADEPLFTKIHIHLYAIAKAVYFKLGLEERWRKIKERSKTFPPQYPRAIAIAEKEERALLNELKTQQSLTVNR